MNEDDFRMPYAPMARPIFFDPDHFDGMVKAFIVQVRRYALSYDLCSISPSIDREHAAEIYKRAILEITGATHLALGTSGR
jgi:hypothetical protein